MTKRLWPGSAAPGLCPECGITRDDWNLEYRVAKLGEERLIAVTCPACRTKFKIEAEAA